ncbi:hypothetical protein P7C70_g1381, partial [Phenoliferia sp. Uapishka_3]
MTQLHTPPTTPNYSSGSDSDASSSPPTSRNQIAPPQNSNLRPYTTSLFHTPQFSKVRQLICASHLMRLSSELHTLDTRLAKWKEEQEEEARKIQIEKRHQHVQSVASGLEDSRMWYLGLGFSGDNRCGTHKSRGEQIKRWKEKDAQRNMARAVVLQPKLEDLILDLIIMTKW